MCKKGNGVYSCLWKTRHRAMKHHLAYEIIQYYLPQVNELCLNPS